MKTLGKILLIATLLSLSALTAKSESIFATMSVDEVSYLLAQSQSSVLAASAKEAVSESDLDQIVPLPVNVNAEDMVTKIYGVVNPNLSRKQCIEQSRKSLRLTPEEEEDVLWLDSDSGYRLNYYGLLPEVSAMAKYENDSLSDFGYFFLFPYIDSDKRDSISRQSEFCGALLQEMYDIGLPMDLNVNTDDLFEAVGDYKGSFIDVRLLDDKGEAGDGRYILILSIEPNAFTPTDQSPLSY